MRSSRQGTTLIETIATMGVLLALGISGATILGEITDIGLQRRLHAQGRAAVDRLSPVIRADIRAADDVEIAGAGWPLDLTRGRELIRYEYDPATQLLRRTQWMRDSSSGEQTVESADRFRLPPRTNAQVDITDNIVTIVLTEAPYPWTIEVVRP